jgi:hypothetical protein
LLSHDKGFDIAQLYGKLNGEKYAGVIENRSGTSHRLFTKVGGLALIRG